LEIKNSSSIPLTIATHMKNIYAKLHVHSRSKAVAKALKENLL